jgi:hypothetical protein
MAKLYEIFRDDEGWRVQLRNGTFLFLTKAGAKEFKKLAIKNDPIKLVEPENFDLPSFLGGPE